MSGECSARLVSGLRRLMPVFSPTEWRINSTAAGLHLVEQDSDRGWRLAGIFLNLGDAFDFGERLHGPLAGFGAQCGDWIARHRPASLESQVSAGSYRMQRASPWHDQIYRSAVANNPFRLGVSCVDVFRHRAWAQAWSEVLGALGRGESVLLSGAPGRGKTLFLQSLSEALARGRLTPRLLRAGDPLDLSAGADVVLVDDAGAAALDALCRSNVLCVLATAPGFVPPVNGLSRAFTPVVLGAVGPDDVVRYVAGRFAAAGRPDELAREAAQALAREADGALREVTILAGAAAFLADLESAPGLSRLHVDQAIALRDRAGQPAAPPVPARPMRRQRAAAVPLHRRRASALLGTLTAGFVLVVASSWTAGRLAGRLGSAEAFGTTGLAAALEARPAEAPFALAAAEGAPGPLPIQAPATRTPAARGGLDALPAPVGTAEAAMEPRGIAVAEVGSAAEPEMAAARAPSAEAELHASTVAYSAPGFFRGPVNNDTIRQSGKLSLVITGQGPSGAIRAKFHAWEGLLGTGELAGKLDADGRISASGQLMMGKNPYLCSLSGFIQGNQLVGSAQFVRVKNGRVAHSSFKLIRI